MIGHSGEDDDRLVEEIYDALDAGEPERALASARIALHEAPDDPILHFLAGAPEKAGKTQSRQPRRGR